VAPTTLPVLIQGPSGVGKELIARAVHKNSARAKGPFLAVNCGAISPSLLESELFGHVKGAFTGAAASRQGLIPASHQGTLFLDEVGELPKEVQVKLLRAVQFGEVQPVGAAQVQRYDVRFVAATNRDLAVEVQEGRFREDLLYRLNAVTLRVPPLRDRSGDILPLFYHFLTTAAERSGRPVPTVEPRLETALMSYGWPGNVRELENETQLLLALSPSGRSLSPDLLSPRLQEALIGVPPPPVSLVPAAVVSATPPEPQTLAQQEKALVELHLRLASGNRTRAAKSLGVSRETLRQMMKRHNIQ
jgi:DNA-binding NtrC family response regulator